MSTIFNAESVDPDAIKEAGRLARRALVIWLVCWIMPAGLGILLSGSQHGEMAVLGLVYLLGAVLVVGGGGSVISLKLAGRAWRLDRSSLLARIMIGLNALTLLWTLSWVVLPLLDYVR